MAATARRLLVPVCCLLPGLVAALLPADEDGAQGVLLAGGLVAVLLCVALWCWGRGYGTPPSGRDILIAALALRLLVLVGPLRFDDDIWRYLWDGVATTHGVSPYRFAPQEVVDHDPAFDPLLYGPEASAALSRLAAAAAEPDLAPVLEHINFPHLPTIYPPTSQLAFGLAALLGPGHPRLWRAVALLGDCAVVALLIGLLSALGRPRWWAAAYGLHPLPALEYGAAGHQDPLGIALLLAATVFLLGQRRALSGAMLAAAAGVKLFPALFLLPWCRRLGVRGVLAFVAAGAGLALPFLLLGLPDPTGLATYVARWEFFSGPYALLAAGAGALGLPLPQGGRWLLLSVLLTLALVSRFWRRHGEEATVLGGWRWVEVLLVLSPVVDPWYVPWGLAAGALRGSLAWPLFAALVPVAHFGFSHEGHPWLLRLVVWVPFLVLLAREQRHGPSQT